MNNDSIDPLDLLLQLPVEATVSRDLLTRIVDTSTDGHIDTTQLVVGLVFAVIGLETELLELRLTVAGENLDED